MVKPRRARPPDFRRPLATVGDLALAVAAGFGVLCIVATLAAVFGGIGLILFSTGSMTPTIPAGSVAVVRTIAAAEVQVGDIVTVERPGRLPVTHRVRAIERAAGTDRVLTLRGDANDSDDTETYRVGSVRIVLLSVPGLAPWIAGTGNPLVLGSLTTGAALLVLWAFWPRRPPPTEPPSQGRPGTPPRRAVRMTGAALMALLTAGFAATPTPARADTSERIVRGRVITLISVGDEEAMASLAPGQPVAWQVGVTSDPPEPGQIELSVRASGPLAQTAAGLQVRLDSCPTRWSRGGCAAGSSPVLAAGAASRWIAPVPAGRLRAGDERWLQVTAWLPTGPAIRAGTASTVIITAVGWGDVIDSDPDHDLPQTGSTASRLLLWLAAGALVTGGAVLVARRRMTR